MLLQNLEQPICRDNGIPCGKLHDALYNSLTPPQNRGVGIPTLIENVIIHNKGKMHIISGSGQLECCNRNGKILKNFYDLHDNNLDRKYYPGTLISIKLRTDTIEVSSDQEEDFSWQF